MIVIVVVVVMERRVSCSRVWRPNAKRNLGFPEWRGGSEARELEATRAIGQARGIWKMRGRKNESPKISHWSIAFRVFSERILRCSQTAASTAATAARPLLVWFGLGSRHPARLLPFVQGFVKLYVEAGGHYWGLSYGRRVSIGKVAFLE